MIFRIEKTVGHTTDWLDLEAQNTHEAALKAAKCSEIYRGLVTILDDEGERYSFRITPGGRKAKKVFFIDGQEVEA